MYMIFLHAFEKGPSVSKKIQKSWRSLECEVEKTCNIPTLSGIPVEHTAHPGAIVVSPHDCQASGDP